MAARLDLKDQGGDGSVRIPPFLRAKKVESMGILSEIPMF